MQEVKRGTAKVVKIMVQYLFLSYTFIPTRLPTICSNLNFLSPRMKNESERKCAGFENQLWKLDFDLGVESTLQTNS